MSLEIALAANTEALLANSALLAQVIGAAANKTAASADDSSDGETADKPKGTRRTKAQIEADKAKEEAEKTPAGITFDALKGKIAAWLGEFAKAEDKDNPDGIHPEVIARRDALKKVFGNAKIGIEKLPEIADSADKMAVLDNWLENTAKKADKGFGIGRLVADPVETEDPADEDDGMDI